MTDKHFDTLRLLGWYSLTAVLFLPTGGMSTAIAIHKTMDYCDKHDCHLLTLD